ncbi:MAG: COX15/CtaA family protein [Planctomycetes bacterium]|nr:COX15/CtaA family protein [Planctomycetota bacterium]
MTLPSAKGHPWIHRMAVLAVGIAVLLTTGLGGAVTSTEVGMAYPTWPDINGMSLFNFFYGEIAEEFGAGAGLEHTHRQAGALIGLLAIGLIIGCHRGGAPLHWRRLSHWTLGLVVAQGALGAVRVLGNSQALAIVHAMGAQLCIVALVALAKHSSKAWTESTQSTAHPEAGRLRLWTRATFFILLLNLVAAASLRHKAGAFSGHFVLALTATVSMVQVMRLSLSHFKDHHGIRAGALRLGVLLTLQLILGGFTWSVLFGPGLGWFDDSQARFVAQSSLATAHLILGVSVLAQVAALDMEARWRVHPS